MEVQDSLDVLSVHLWESYAKLVMKDCTKLYHFMTEKHGVAAILSQSHPPLP